MLVLIILLADARLDKLVAMVGQGLEQFPFVNFSLFALIVFLQKCLLLPWACLRGVIKLACSVFSIVKVDSEGVLTELVHNCVFNKHHSFSIRTDFWR